MRSSFNSSRNVPRSAAHGGLLRSPVRNSLPRLIGAERVKPRAIGESNVSGTLVRSEHPVDDRKIMKHVPDRDGLRDLVRTIPTVFQEPYVQLLNGMPGELMQLREWNAYVRRGEPIGWSDPVRKIGYGGFEMLCRTMALWSKDWQEVFAGGITGGRNLKNAYVPDGGTFLDRLHRRGWVDICERRQLVIDGMTEVMGALIAKGESVRHFDPASGLASYVMLAMDAVARGLQDAPGQRIAQLAELARGGNAEARQQLDAFLRGEGAAVGSPTLSSVCRDWMAANVLEAKDDCKRDFGALAHRIQFVQGDGFDTDGFINQRGPRGGLLRDAAGKPLEQPNLLTQSGWTCLTSSNLRVFHALFNFFVAAAPGGYMVSTVQVNNPRVEVCAHALPAIPIPGLKSVDTRYENMPQRSIDEFGAMARAVGWEPVGDARLTPKGVHAVFVLHKPTDAWDGEMWKQYRESEPYQQERNAKKPE